MKKIYQKNSLIGKRSHFLLLLLVSMVNASHGQTLTKAQMLDDMNFLQSHVNEYCAFVPLLEKRTGVSVNAEFDQLKKTITGPEPIDKFIETVREGLNFLNDWHSGIANKQEIIGLTNKSYYLSPISNVTLADTLHADYYQSLITDSIYSKIKCGFRIEYMDGRYYNVQSFTYNDISIQSGEEIRAIDGIPINRFVNKYRSQMLFPFWDPIHKQWYDGAFMFALPPMGMQKFTLIIGNKTINFDCAKPVENLQQGHSQSYYPKITLLNSHTLYIFMPSMMNSSWYIQELFRVYTPSVNKIIIDIRGNGGGSDGVWQDLLKKIIDKPLKFRYCVGMKHNALLEKAVSSFGKIRVTGNNAVLTDSVTILPDSNSVHFKGRIYILQNQYTYSAAAALSSVAMQENNMILIGERSALISGYSFPAILFKLPKSGIVFNLAFAYDMSGGEEN